jgi:hypothetical protein
MPKTSATEWLLARLTTPDRAAAILGDLEELSATRGRLWFWTTYARMLISLGWRTPVAFVLAIVGMRLFFSTILPCLTIHTRHHLSDPGLFGQENLRVSIFVWNVSLVTAQALCFVLPYVALRFGLRNRLTLLASGLFILAVPVYVFTPWVRDLSGILTTLAVIIALAAPLWRKPLTVIAGTILTAATVKILSVPILVGIYHRNFFMVPASKRSLLDVLAFAVATMVCVFLHRRLLQRRPAIA